MTTSYQTMRYLQNSKAQTGFGRIEMYGMYLDIYRYTKVITLHKSFVQLQSNLPQSSVRPPVSYICSYY